MGGGWNGERRVEMKNEKKRKNYQEEVVVLGLTPQVLEDGLFPVPLHQIPVLDLTLADGVGETVGLLVGDSLITNEEIEVFHSLLLGHLSGVLGCNDGGDDELGLGVSSETHLGVTLKKEQGCGE